MSSNPHSHSSSVSDPDFLQLLKSRDPQLLENIFRETNPILLKIAAANGVFSENAEDIVYQTWERFFTNLEKFEGRSELRTFICGILINKIREYRRSSGKIIYVDDSDAVMEHSFTKDGWWKVEAPEPSAAMQASETSAFIKECLEGLTEAQKTAFILKEVEQEKSSEICNVLGVSVSNLRVLIFRAKDKLRQCLDAKFRSSERINETSK